MTLNEDSTYQASADTAAVTAAGEVEGHRWPAGRYLRWRGAPGKSTREVVAAALGRFRFLTQPGA